MISLFVLLEHWVIIAFDSPWLICDFSESARTVTSTQQPPQQAT
jgi:hypothetical protein